MQISVFRLFQRYLSIFRYTINRLRSILKYKSLSAPLYMKLIKVEKVETSLNWRIFLHTHFVHAIQNPVERASIGYGIYACIYPKSSGFGLFDQCVIVTWKNIWINILKAFTYKPAIRLYKQNFYNCVYPKSSDFRLFDQCVIVTFKLIHCPKKVKPPSQFCH